MTNTVGLLPGRKTTLLTISLIVPVSIIFKLFVVQDFTVVLRS